MMAKPGDANMDYWKGLAFIFLNFTLVLHKWDTRSVSVFSRILAVLCS